jgi:hypothetical protein
MVEVDLGEFGSLGSRARRRQDVQRPATGTLGTVPEDAYQVTLRYGDGRPRTIRFNRDIRISGFPCRAGIEVGFSRTGEMFAATLSEPHSFGKLRFAPRTLTPRGLRDREPRTHGGRSSRPRAPQRVGLGRRSEARGGGHAPLCPLCITAITTVAARPPIRVTASIQSAPTLKPHHCELTEPGLANTSGQQHTE